MNGMVKTMRVTIDTAGRIVVPKALRAALGLTAGQDLDAYARDGRLEIEPAPTPMHLRKKGRGVVAVSERKLPHLTADEVRATLEAVRR